VDTAQLLELFGYLEYSAELRNRRAATAMHHELGSTLAALNMHLAILFQQMAAAEAPNERVERVKALLAGASQAARKIQGDLWPDKLEVLGLHAAIVDLAAEFESRTGVRCHVRVAGRTDHDLRTQIALFRTAEEALLNVATHARANQIDISLEETATRILLCIRDDGNGLSKNRASIAVGHGLRLMRERIRGLGGRFQISSTPGRGTSVFVSVPRICGRYASAAGLRTDVPTKAAEPQDLKKSA
jgi:signal transduction histidine kinase